RRQFPEDHPNIRDTTDQLRTVLEARGDKSALDTLAKEEAELKSRLDSPEYQVQLAGLLLRNNPTNSQKQEARQLIRWAIEEYGQVAVEYPGVLDRRVKALNGYAEAIGQCAAAKGFEGEVEELNRRLEAELPKLVVDFPDSSNCQWRAAVLYRNWAVQLLPYSDYLSTAERVLRESIKFHEKLTQSDLKQPGAWLYLADRN